MQATIIWIKYKSTVNWRDLYTQVTLQEGDKEIKQFSCNKDGVEIAIIDIVTTQMKVI